MVKITAVQSGSAAARAGILAGDELISINGKAITDVLDYRFYLCEKKLTIALCRDGSPVTVKLRKGEYDDIGLEFETFLMDKKHSCKNKCIFCFIDQLPKGMRDTLYFKDDDSRLSFLQGNYITMTNLSDADVTRIIEMKMSPINVSVHTTNPELRTFMLKNPNAGSSLAYLRRFADAGTELNCQIVLCRGINDGAELERTMHDLAALYPSVTSVSVVPAGMTRFREKLTPLTPFSAEEARAVIGQVETFAAGCMEAFGTRIFCAADELYLEAGLAIPTADYYEEFKQIENGVGMIASMREEFADACSAAEDDGRTASVSLATGTAAYPLMCEFAANVKTVFPHVDVRVYEVKNRFFGESITVAGLLTGQDILDTLCGKPLGERLLLPACALRHGGDLFLDGVTLDDFSASLGVPVRLCRNDGYDLFDAMCGNDLL